MRRLFVTGASSEIGQKLILDQEQNFDQVIAHYNKTPGPLETLKAALGEKIELVHGDFSDAKDTERMIACMRENNWLPSDIVHLSAGKFQLKNFSKTPWETFQQNFDISVRSVVMILQAFLPPMSRAHDGRVVIMLSSVTEGVPPKYLSYYIAVKYAMLGLVRELSAEYAEKGISINGISPEMTNTKYLSSVPALVRDLNIKGSPRGRLLEAEDIMPAFRLFLSKDGKAVTGQNLLITDGK